MAFFVRRLGPADEDVLRILALEDADFDISERGGPREPLNEEASRAYLEDPTILHWVVEEEGKVVGHLYCHLLPKRAGDSAELLLYEIGVRQADRRRGVGRILVDEMKLWMNANDIREVWVLADNPGAITFYRACGFAVPEQSVYLTLKLDGSGPLDS